MRPRLLATAIQSVALVGAALVFIGVSMQDSPMRLDRAPAEPPPSYVTITDNPDLVGLSPEDFRRHIVPCGTEEGGPEFPCVWDGPHRGEGGGDFLVYSAPDTVDIRFVY